MKKFFNNLLDDYATENLEIDFKFENDQNIYMNDDPFDFYREAIDEDQYIPITQNSVRKSFSAGLIGLEFFIEMATSLRPLADEAQDLDEITRMFSQQKLSSRATPHSVEILRNMIKDSNPEIALYAAEGLNSIENSYIEKIIKYKDDIDKAKKENYDKYYKLGAVYQEFSTLLEGQTLIQKFYLSEAIKYLKKAYSLKKNNYTVVKKLAECYLFLEEYKEASNIYNKLFEKKDDDIDLLFQLAECYYNMGKYDEVKYMIFVINKLHIKIDNLHETVVYQWIL